MSNIQHSHTPMACHLNEALMEIYQDVPDGNKDLLVCQMNLQHPKCKAYGQLFADAPQTAAERDRLKVDLDAQIKRGDIWQEEAEGLRERVANLNHANAEMLGTKSRAEKAEKQRDELLAACKGIKEAFADKRFPSFEEFAAIGAAIARTGEQNDP